jgi:hypothetical protein
MATTRMNLVPVIKANGNMYVVSEPKYLMRISSDHQGDVFMVTYDLKQKNTIAASRVTTDDVPLNLGGATMSVDERNPVKLNMKDVTLTKEYAGRVGGNVYVLIMYPTLNGVDPVDVTKPLKLAIRDRRPGEVFLKEKVSEDHSPSYKIISR